MTRLVLLLALAGPPLSVPTQGAEAARDGLLVVLDKADDTARVIDPASGEVRALLDTGDGPHEALALPDGRVVVSNYGSDVPGGSLTVLDAAGGRVLAEVDLGGHRRPHGLAWAGRAGRCLVTAEEDRALLEVDLDAGEVVRVLPTGAAVSHMVALGAPGTPAAGRAFVANIGSGSVSVIDLEEGRLVATVPTGEGCEGIAVSPDGREVWTANRAADTLSILDARRLEPLASLEMPGFPIRVVFTPDGSRALVTLARAGELAVLDAAERRLEGVVGMHVLLGDEGAGETLFGEALGPGPVPVGVLLHPDGRTAFVAASAASRVAVVDLASLEITGAFATGTEPDGLAWVPASPPAGGEPR